MGEIGRREVIGAGLALGAFAETRASAQTRPETARAQASDRWATVWTGSVQGPYPVGNPSAQPDQRFAFPDPATGARDQTFRLVVAPSLWTGELRLRFSNAFGTRALVLDGAFVGLVMSSAAIMPGTNRAVRFGGRAGVTIPAGGSAWSDPVALPFSIGPGEVLEGRRLAVSFHVVGESGPMTWHAKALTTSYVTPPGAGARGQAEDETAFTYTTASWFFLDAVDMRVPAGTEVIVAFGDSITDGTASTMNGDDRWPDVLQRRLRTAYGSRFVVVNAGIGGNQIVGPAEYGPGKPFPGGPSALARLERDVLQLSGVASVIWLEGINDFSRNGGRLRRGRDRRDERRRRTHPGGDRRRAGHRGDRHPPRSAPRVRRTASRSRTRSARR